MRCAAKRVVRTLAFSIALLASFASSSAEFRSIAETGTVLYDAPSARSGRLFVASRFMPVEVVVSIEGWTKVRDQAGDLAWVEKKALSELRTVVVTTTAADCRQAPDGQSAIVFQAGRGVALELIEMGPGEWVRVRHSDGQSGFVRVTQLWGL